MSEYATTADVRAWDTEYGDIVVWGTHNPTIARTAAKKYYLEVVMEQPEHLDEVTPPIEEFRAATRYWADPKVLEKDDESPWEPGEYMAHEDGLIPYDRWVPYMVVTL